MTRRPRRTAVVRAPDLRIETRRTGTTVRCALVGALHQDNQDAFARALHRGLRSRPERLRVDLRAVDLFTSSALDTLLRARHAAAVLGVAMALDSPSACVRRVLEITRAGPFLPVEDGGPGPAPRRTGRGRAEQSRTGPPGSGPTPSGPGRGPGLRRHWG
ncbi:anti-anti-sigma factor [Kitasatospora cineracea]|uniref:Anti-anti-sigma factor n=1 Tax=Kitasatospora cineracea TaxID=88074 RepID=A0A3N4S1A1_9ACTN|nr:anti-anti-sigma factor [Kitasatospora cineracea]